MKKIQILVLLLVGVLSLAVSGVHAKEVLSWSASEGAIQYIVEFWPKPKATAADGDGEIKKYVYKTASTSVPLTELRIPFGETFLYTVAARSERCLSEPSAPIEYTRGLPEDFLPETLCISGQNVEVIIKVTNNGK